VRRVVFPAPRTFLEKLLGGGGGDEAVIRADEQHAALIRTLPADVQRSLRYLSLFERVRPGETMAILPYDLRIR
jgi:hypothetical protein